jgi:uncharacterized membrane protein YgcG
VRRLAVTFLLVVGFFSAAPAAESISSFSSAVVLQPDGVLDVTETITVAAEGNKINHGIYRDFPLTFTDANGHSHRVGFTVREITRDGKPEPWHKASNQDGIRIYIGDGDVLLDPGTYTYRIRYTTARQIRFFPDHTELFWNVTGNDWAFPILKATALFTLPDDQAPVRWTAYTGRYGERGVAYDGAVALDNQLRVATTRPLDAGEGLSVVLEIPEGLVLPPSGTQALYYWFLDNRHVVFGVVGLVGVLIFYLLAWNAVGRDPPKGTIIPLFYAPPGISPTLAGYIRDYGWKGGWRKFTAAALALAVKGLLTFNDSGDDIVLTRTKLARPQEKLPPGENSLLKWVESKGGEVTINKDNGKSLQTAFANFKSSVENESRNRFFRRNLGYFIAGAALTAVSIASVLAWGGLRDAEIGLLFGTVFASVWLGVFIIPIVRALAATRNVESILKAGFAIAAVVFIGFTFVSAFSEISRSLPTGFGWTALDVLMNNGFPLALIGGFAVMNGLFYYLLRAPTAAGRAVMDQIEGLELYIRTAESNRLNLAGAPDLNATQFERILPYAVALNAEKPWSEAFATAFARANPGQDVATAYNPAWHGGHGWSGASFARSISSAVSSAESSFASSIPAPSSSSSGFSGGGGSGGGGGGGGGGGW